MNADEKLTKALELAGKTHDDLHSWEMADGIFLAPPRIGTEVESSFLVALRNPYREMMVGEHQTPEEWASILRVA